MSADIMGEWFHQASVAVAFVAFREGWLHDSERVRRAVYDLYEHGELRHAPPDTHRKETP